MFLTQNSLIWWMSWRWKVLLSIMLTSMRRRKSIVWILCSLSLKSIKRLSSASQQKELSCWRRRSHRWDILASTFTLRWLIMTVRESIMISKLVRQDVLYAQISLLEVSIFFQSMLSSTLISQDSQRHTCIESVDQEDSDISVSLSTSSLTMIRQICSKSKMIWVPRLSRYPKTSIKTCIQSEK